MSTAFYEILSEVDGSGIIMTAFAGENLGNHKLVFAASDGTCWLADADDDDCNPAMGLTLSAATTGQTCQILLLGYIRDLDWSWTVGGPDGVIYVSDDVGELTQSPGINEYPVAVALSSDRIYFHPCINNFNIAPV